jgi:hypothetical protein
MNNVHEDEPVVFESRWAMSYLCGPLTREQIKTLVEPTKKQRTQSTTTPQITSGKPMISSTPISSMMKSSKKPLIPPEVPEFFVPLELDAQKEGNLIYKPMVVGAAQMRFIDLKIRVDTTIERVFVAPISDNPLPVNWDEAKESNIKISDLKATPTEDFEYANPPSVALKKQNYKDWEKDFTNYLFRTQKIRLLRSPSLNEVSRLGESERDFRVRLQQNSREKRDAQVEKLREKYDASFRRLEEKIRKAQNKFEEQQAQAKSQKYQVAASFGETLLGSFLGRKSSSRMSKATKAISRSMKESRDRENAQEDLKALQQERKELEDQFKSEVAEVEIKNNPLTETMETVQVSPTKTNISVQLLALAWKAQ